MTAPDRSVLRRRAAAAYIGVHVNTLYNLRKTDPTFPPEVRITKVSVGWRKCDLDAWIDSRRSKFVLNPENVTVIPAPAAADSKKGGHRG